jgi:predicted HTH domain antitoxin
VDYVYGMSEVRFTLPEDAAAALGVAPDAIGETVRLAAAIKLYELGRLSAGAAAELAGVPVPVLLSRLAEYQVDAFRLSAEEIAHDARSV